MKYLLTSITGWCLLALTHGAAAAQDYVPAVTEGLKLVRLTQDGGRLDWYKGKQHDLIAFDAIVDASNRNTELFTIRPDGSGRRCVTCTAGTPKGFVGQPAWHPDGEHIVIQVENQRSGHRLWEHVAWGINNDLWMVRRDGSEAELIYATRENHAVLHAHFNQDGSCIIFAERVPTGRVSPRLRHITPGGENPWSGWRIHIADVDMHKRGSDRLSNHRILFDGDNGLFETHGFTQDARIVFSHTENGRAYMDDIYIADSDGAHRRRLVHSPATWEEHGSYSPSGKSMAFVSSRGYADWRAPHSTPKTLRLDLYLQRADNEPLRLTYANKDIEKGMRYIVSDFDWDAGGSRIAFQVAPFDDRANRPGLPQIWILTFAEPQ